MATYFFTTMLILLALLCIGGFFDKEILQNKDRAYDIFVGSIVLIIIAVIAIGLIQIIFTAILV